MSSQHLHCSFRYTYVFKAEELITTVVAQRASICQQFFQRRWFWRIGVPLRDRVARCWAGWGLQRRQYMPLCTLHPSRALTVPDLRRPKNELIMAARSDGRTEQWGADEVVVVQAAQGICGAGLCRYSANKCWGKEARVT